MNNPANGNSVFSRVYQAFIEIGADGSGSDKAKLARGRTKFCSHMGISTQQLSKFISEPVDGHDNHRPCFLRKIEHMVNYTYIEEGKRSSELGFLPGEEREQDPVIQKCRAARRLLGEELAEMCGGVFLTKHQARGVKDRSSDFTDFLGKILKIGIFYIVSNSIIEFIIT